ncbi:translation initiation factor IF-2, mitochondrial-like isoform X2 [Mercenaria mercenaria]|nr:translation initiation factor IF-2, mitochondrial-like isoform X2 [Mercenaria mercenaria]XP_053398763.1 translation initiation factor IF-2, mitochondrial-like isoform X2 [Mercenaria mercenaria]
MLKRRFKIVTDKKSSPDKQAEQVEDKVIKKPLEKDIEKQGPPDPDKLVYRPPVVTIMGHVDHGKTTLLDALRESSVVDQEFGGITQHIGAFNVKLPSGHSITFLDTPGHAAFSAMRARGASVTDIIVLVIAAEDGIMPQTIESIKLAQAENVPLIVAINKIDKYEANINKTKNMLAQYGVVVEEYGGDVQAVPISALKKTNLDKLEESITTLAELLELKGDQVGMVEGYIVETRTDIGRGKMATILVQRGSLKKGDILIAGTTWTKVRNMYDSNGKIIELATPSMPVEIGGWKELPLIGDEVLQVDTEKRLKKAIEYRVEKKLAEKEEQDFNAIEEKRREERETYVKKRAEKFEYMKSRGFRRPAFASLTSVERLMNDGALIENPEKISAIPTFYLIIKGDVAGSVEAILDTLATFKSEVCNIDILHSGVGNVTPYDLELAELFEGVIYAFNVSTESQQTEHQKVEIKSHNVIYHLFDDLIQMINDRLPDVTEEEVIGEAKILQEYVYTEKKKDKKKQIAVAGCRCLSGSLEKKHLFKVVRNDDIIYDGKLSSLKHHKEEVSSIETNQECGICFNGETVVSFKAGDTVICYKNVQKTQTLDWEPGYLHNVSQKLY